MPTAFDTIPDFSAPARAGDFTACIADLIKSGDLQQAETFTPAKLTNKLIAWCSRKIRNEMTNDPKALGYAGKTNAEVAAILNAPTPEKEWQFAPFKIAGKQQGEWNGALAAYDPNTPGMTPLYERKQVTVLTGPSRWSQISQAIPFAPNVVTEAMIAEAIANGI